MNFIHFVLNHLFHIAFSYPIHGKGLFIIFNKWFFSPRSKKDSAPYIGGVIQASAMKNSLEARISAWAFTWNVRPFWRSERLRIAAVFLGSGVLGLEDRTEDLRDLKMNDIEWNEWNVFMFSWLLRGFSTPSRPCRRRPWCPGHPAS